MRWLPIWARCNLPIFVSFLRYRITISKIFTSEAQVKSATANTLLYKQCKNIHFHFIQQNTNSRIHGITEIELLPTSFGMIKQPIFLISIDLFWGETPGIDNIAYLLSIFIHWQSAKSRDWTVSAEDFKRRRCVVSFADIIRAMVSFLVFCLLITVCSITSPSHSTASTIEDRVAVLDNNRPPIEFVFGFHSNEGKLRFKQYLKGSWSKW